MATFVLKAALLLAIGLAAIFVIDSQAPVAPYPTASATQPAASTPAYASRESVLSLKNALQSALEDGDLRTWFNVEATVLSLAPESDAFSLYQSTLLDAIETRLEYGIGEPLIPLARTLSISQMSEQEQDDETALRLARVLLSLDMPYQALTLLNATESKSPEGRELSALIESFIATTNAMSPWSFQHQDPLLVHLESLVTMPSEGQYTGQYFAALREHLESRQHPRPDSPKILRGLAGFTNWPYGVASEKLGPVTAPEYSARILDSIEVTSSDLLRSLAHASALGDEALRQLLSSNHLFVQFSKEAAFLRVDGEQIQVLNQTTDGPAEWVAVDGAPVVVHLYERGFVAGYLAGGESLLFFYDRDASSSQARLVRTTATFSSIELVDVVALEGMEIWLVDRKSSGGFATPMLFASSGDLIWTHEAVYHGQVSLIQFDSDTDREIVVSGGSRDRIGDGCNQCPTQFRSAIFDFEPTSSSFTLRHVSNSIVEVGAWGTSQAILSMDAETFTWNATDAIVDLEREEEMDAEELEQNLEGIHTGIMRLFQIEDYSKAADFARRLRYLDKARVDTQPQSKLLIWSSIAWGARALSRAGSPQEALEWVSDEWILETASGNEGASAELAQLRAEILLASRDLAATLQQLEGLGIGENFSPEVLLLEEDFYRLIGDVESERSTAHRLLDVLTYVLNHDSTFDMSFRRRRQHAAALTRLGLTEMRRSRLDLALLWISRSLPVARREGGPFAFAANLAAARASLARGGPELGLTFLDQALSTVTEKTWEEHGAVFLLSAGEAMEQLGSDEQAIRFYRAALRESQERDPLVSSAAWSRLALVFEKKGALREAVEALESAVGAIVEARSRAPLEQHKFIVIEGKESVFSRYLELAFNSDWDDKRIFENIQKWKLQVFRDIAGIQAELAPRASNPVNEARVGSSGPDFAVDYYVSGPHVVASVIRGDELSVKQLPTTESELEELSLRIARHFSVRDSQMMEHIRKDRAPDELMSALGDAYNLLIRGLGLSIRAKSKLTISPSGPLYGIPWAALLDDGAFLVEKADIALTPTLGFSDNHFGRIHASSGSRNKRALLVGAFGSVE